ncbi:hypothetical protein [Cyclobacterium qasimii]|uniref:Uncharacterized protein n=2 Tax=Cyclobacterium qasimii TaxID=1350429 RepID=S7WPF2_9BACT|nr:hypothetical protein [Cyclobacterium qasimii]EPR68614.1 hypothetical protein ADICYQ_2311 [Cyclobacterium qasimii M12-11B]GEO23498.1 hypothetical protein CQA01_40320 [Cyclobacterium qasimii]
MDDLTIAHAKVQFEKIKDFDLTEIALAHRIEKGIELEEALERTIELKKWLVMASVNPKANYQITGPIDQIWHTFLKYTKVYHEFCTKLGKFIHHIPQDQTQLLESRNNNDLFTQMTKKFENGYLSIIKDYKEVFNVNPPINVWPKEVKNHSSDSGGGCGGTRCAVFCSYPD